jgi:hypothetical protein
MALRGYLNAALTVAVLALLLLAGLIVLMVHLLTRVDSFIWNHPVYMDGANYIMAGLIGWGCD